MCMRMLELGYAKGLILLLLKESSFECSVFSSCMCLSTYKPHHVACVSTGQFCQVICYFYGNICFLFFSV